VFGISLPELFVIFAVALIVFGPEKLPEIARNFGKLMADLKRSSDSVRREFYNSVYKPAEDSKDGLSLVTRELRGIKQDLLSELKREPTAPPPIPLEKPVATDQPTPPKDETPTT